MYIAKVDSEATGGGHYNCYLQKIDADDWDTDNDPFENIDDETVIVLNLPEKGTDKHNLTADDLIMCFRVVDDDGNNRYVGNETLGRTTYGTQVE
jgi:hypothetical protein